jgi:hypothetical protein
LVAPSLPPGDDYKMANGHTCHDTGNAHRQRNVELNQNKNRDDGPGTDAIDSDISLSSLVGPGEDENRFEVGKGATVVGFVMDAKVGGDESCNCNATNPVDMDTHIELGLGPDTPPNQRVIVEVTPRLRLKMKQQGIDWTTDGLANGDNRIIGKWVKVTGWTLFDWMHTDGAENSSPGKSGNWRATCWEIHPITSLEVLADRPADAPVVQPAFLSTLQRAHARQVSHDPQMQQRVEARNKQCNEALDPQDLKEKQDEAQKVRAQQARPEHP